MSRNDADRELKLVQSGIDRRRFLRTAGEGALAALAGGFAAPFLRAPLLAQDEPKKKKAGPDAEPSRPYAPFRIAIQSYSLRKFHFEKMVNTILDLDLKMGGLYPRHFPMHLVQF